MSADKACLKKKYEKVKERKNELKKLVIDVDSVNRNERRAAAKKNSALEKENRALRHKIIMMKLDHEEMKPDVEYDTDDCKSADEEEMVDEESCEEEMVETDSESDGSEEWDLFLERKTK